MSRGRALIEEEGERLGVRSRTLPMPERRRRRDVGTAGADAGASQRDIEGGRAVRPCGRAVLRTRTPSRRWWCGCESKRFQRCAHVIDMKHT